MHILEFDVNMDPAICITNIIVNVHLNILMIKIVYPFSTQSNLCPFYIRIVPMHSNQCYQTGTSIMKNLEMRVYKNLQGRFN